MPKPEVSEPIHTALVNGYPVRFHIAPGARKDAVMPWVERDDLLAAVECNDTLWRALIVALDRDFAGAGAAIETDRGAVQAIPGWLGQDTVAMLEQAAVIPPALGIEFSSGYYGAAGEVMDDHPSIEQSSWMVAALMRENVERTACPGYRHWQAPPLN